MTDENVYRAHDWPHGLRCGECSHLFTDGERIVDQLNCLIDDIPCTTPVCEPCGLEKPVR
jgi:hypothetical protein